MSPSEIFGKRKAATTPEETKARIEYAYPYPIAAPFRRYITKYDPAEKGDCLFHVYEALVRHLSLVVAADLLGGNPPAKEGLDRLRKVLERPHGMGVWSQVLLEAQKVVAGRDCPFAQEVLRIASEGEPGGALSSEYQTFVSERNRLEKKLDRPPSAYLWRRFVSEWESRVISRLVMLEQLLVGRFVRYGAGASAPPRAEYWRQALSGFSDPFEGWMETHEAPLPTERVLWLDAESTRFCDLSAFYRFEPCDRCEDDHMFVFKSASEGRWEFADPRTGHLLTKKAGSITDHEFPRGGVVRVVREQSRPAARPTSVVSDLGPIEVLFELSKGRYGAVSLARYGDDRLCVLKVLEETRNLSSRMRCKFEKEVDNLRLIDHPNVVRLLGTASVTGMQAIVLEYCSGGDLKDRLTEAEPLSTATALSLMTDIAEGVAALHGRGLVHRDLKPQNIFVDEGGRAKIGDLGLTRPIHDARTTGATGSPAGTPGYMPPEVLRGSPWAHAGDIYSLGLIFRQILSLAGVPWLDEPGKRSLSALTRDLDSTSEKMEPASIIRNGREVFARMLSDDPKGRPPVDLIRVALAKLNPEALALAGEQVENSTIVAVLTENDALSLLQEEFPAVDARWLRYFLQVGIGHAAPINKELAYPLFQIFTPRECTRYAIKDYALEERYYEAWRSLDGRIALVMSRTPPDVYRPAAFPSEPWNVSRDVNEDLGEKVLHHALFNPCGIRIGNTITVVTDPDSLAGSWTLKVGVEIPGLPAPWVLDRTRAVAGRTNGRVVARRPIQWDALLVPVAVSPELRSIGDYRIVASRSDEEGPSKKIIMAVAEDMDRFDPEAAGSVMDGLGDVVKNLARLQRV